MIFICLNDLIIQIQNTLTEDMMKNVNLPYGIQLKKLKHFVLAENEVDSKK